MNLKSLKTKLAGALKSKTIMFNVATALVEFANWITPTIAPATGTAISIIGNIILRFVTNSSLESKAEPVPPPEPVEGSVFKD